MTMKEIDSETFLQSLSMHGLKEKFVFLLYQAWMAGAADGEYVAAGGTVSGWDDSDIPDTWSQWTEKTFGEPL